MRTSRNPRKSKWLLFPVILSCLVSVGTTANAASIYDFGFSGVVTSAVEVPIPSAIGPPRQDLKMVGESFDAVVAIQTGVPSPLGFAALRVDVVGLGGAVVPLSPTESSHGALYFGAATFDGTSGAIQELFSFGKPSFTFTLLSGIPSSSFSSQNAILTAQIGLQGVDRADAGGVLNLTLQANQAFLDVIPFSVSPVPLPPALPMFASALLALAIVGYVGRKRAASA